MKILVAFGTSGGNTQLVASKISEVLTGLGGHNVEIVDMYDLAPESLANYELVFIGCSTWGDGEYTDAAQVFFDKVKDTEIDLSAVKVAIYGLGESFYPIFCNVVELMKADLEAKQAKIIGEPLKIDGFPDDGNMSKVETWVKTIMDQNA